MAEKADKLLSWLAKTHPKAGELMHLHRERDVSEAPYPTDIAYPLSKLPENQIEPQALARSWCADRDEFVYVVDDYMAKARGWIETPSGASYRLTPEGWSHFHDLQRTHADSSIGFIAMHFDPGLNPLRDTIEGAISKAGYEPLRIDKYEHNNQIVDEIIAAIRRSKFVVADFTGQRGGVYFEAGFALGLGQQVIWLCRRDEVEEKKVHFDVQQFNFIVWEQDKLKELEDRLQFRIERTLSRGPLQVSGASAT